MSDADPGQDADPDHGACQETVDPATRKTVLKGDDYECQVCGRPGAGAGGVANLEVHHKRRDVPEDEVHDLSNLVTLCEWCHSWFHRRPTSDTAPVGLSAEDEEELMPLDIKILRVLAEEGPASTGEITTALNEDPSVMTVRERLWVLMGLDNRVESRDRQIVDQAVETGEWGLVGQIETSKRGRIPESPQSLLQRIEDEYVRQAMSRGVDRATIQTVFDISKRTTFYKEKRAHAYDFPLEAIDNRGGKPRADEADEEPTTASDGMDGKDEQQRLDAVADGSDESIGETETVSGSATERRDESADAPRNGHGEDGPSESGEGADADTVRELLQQAIDTLGSTEPV